MIHTGELVARMARQSSTGARIPFSLSYYKANGTRIDVPSATFLSLDRPSDTVLIQCPGGPRRIRLYCIMSDAARRVATNAQKTPTPEPRRD